MRLSSKFFVVLMALVLAQYGGLAAQAANRVIFEETFENGDGPMPDGWRVFSGTSMQRSTAESHNGENSFFVKDDSSAGALGLRSPAVPVVPGNLYTAEAWILAKRGVPQLYLEFWDAGGKRVDVVFQGLGSDDWSNLAMPRVAPPTAKTATVLLYSHKANVGESYFDDIRILEQGDDKAVTENTSSNGSSSATNKNSSLKSLPTSKVLVPVPAVYTDRPTVLGRTFTAQVEGHPRLQFTPDELATLQEKIAGNESGFGVNYKLAAEAVQRSADTHFWKSEIAVGYYGGYTVNYPIPVEQPGYRPNPPGFTAGRYPFWTGLGGQIKNRLQALALGYAVSGKQKYADKAKVDLLALAKWNVWSDPDYSCGGATCLDTGYIVEGVSLAYDILYDQLSEEERAEIRTALVEKGLKPLYSDTAQKLDHNIHMVRTAAMGMGALTLLGEEPGMEDYVLRAYDNFLWYLNQRLDSGNTEGMLYTSVSMDHITPFATALERVTGDRSMFEHPFVKQVLPRWIIYFLSPGGKDLVNFSDADLGIYFAATMAAIGRVNQNEQANWYMQRTVAGGADLRLLQLDHNGKEEDPSDWPASAVFADIGWTALRSGWESRGTLLAFNSSGSNMGHNHYDQNNFTLNLNGTWLIKDAGYQDYNPGPKNEATYHTLGHNAVLVNGRGQSMKGGGKTVAAFLTPGFDYVVGDASNAYAATSLSKWARHIFYAKPEYFVIFDDMLLRAATDKPEVLFHPGATIKVDGDIARVGYSEAVNHFTIGGSALGLDAQVVWPAKVNMSVEEIKGAEEYGPYISIKPDVSDEQVQMVTVFTPLGYQDEAPQVSQVEADAARIRFQVGLAERTDYLCVGLDSSAKATADPADGEVISTDALHALAAKGTGGSVLQYTLVDGSALYLGNQKLVDSSVTISVAVARDDTGKWLADIAADSAGTAQLWLPGEDGQGSMVSVKVEKGTSSLQL